MASPSQATPLTKVLGEAESKVAQCLAYGHGPSIAKAIMDIGALREAVFTSFVSTICGECNALCQRSGTSLFRTIAATDLANTKWGAFMEELQSKAPTLLHLLTTIVTFNDHRNVSKVGVSHHPGICAAVAVLLKERSREMCAIQSIVSVLMYTCHSDKQVARAL